MAIHEIHTPTTPWISMKTHFPSPKTGDPTQFSPPTTPDASSESTIHEYIESAQSIIGKWDPKSPSLEKFTLLFQENRTRATEFAKCVENLRTAMHFLIAQRSVHSKHLVQANKLMKIAMQQLEREFHHILSTNMDCLMSPKSASSPSSHYQLSRSASDEDDRIESDGDMQSQRAMSDLKLIAESMISSGYSKECGRIYKITRKSMVDEELYRLGIRVYTTSQINRMDHDSLEHQVTKWIYAAGVAVRTLFQGERTLCDHLFDVSETVKETCIAHTTVEGAINLLRFPEIVARRKRSPDKIFFVIGLYEAVSELWPEIESIFGQYPSLSPVKLKALSSMHKITHSAQTILSGYVSSIQKNPPGSLIPGGGIHPLTCSVMNYVALLADNSGTISDIISGETESAAAAVQLWEEYLDSPSPVSTRLAWIILVLLCKLDSKAGLYKDIGLSYLFLANNLQFVADKVNTTALRLLLGQDWLTSLQKKVRLYAANYESVSWSKVLSYLLPNELDHPKERLRRFNSAFEAAYRKQSAWVVPDPRLRDEIKVSIAGKLVPAYRGFYERYVGTVSSGDQKNMDVLVRYSPDNLGNYLSDFFHATTRVVSGDSLSTSSAQPSLWRCL